MAGSWKDPGVVAEAYPARDNPETGKTSESSLWLRFSTVATKAIVEGRRKLGKYANRQTRPEPEEEPSTVLVSGVNGCSQTRPAPALIDAGLPEVSIAI